MKNLIAVALIVFSAVALFPTSANADESWTEQSVTVRQFQPAPYAGLLLSELAVQMLLADLRRNEQEIDHLSAKALTCEDELTESAAECDSLRSEVETLFGTLWACESALQATPEPSGGRPALVWSLVAGLVVSVGLNVYLITR